jgi:DNA-binding transcriptional MerR regulator
MDEARDRLRIGEFAELVGLSIPQLRRYDRLQLLEPAARSQDSGYRYYSSGQTGAARVIALLRSMDMPISEIRRIVSGASDAERRRILQEHRARLEVRLDEVRRLLDAVEAMTKGDMDNMGTRTEISSWLHVMPHVPVRDMQRSISYYEEALGFQLAWRTVDRSVAALSSGEIEILLLTPWTEDSPLPTLSAYVYVEDPDALCAEYQQAGADVLSPVATRSYGMRDFVVQDPDGNRFTLGRGDEKLREVAGQYGMMPDEIAVNPKWLERRKRR